MKVSTLAALALLAPVAAFASPFEKHSGQYDVVTAPQGFAGGCALGSAAIARESYGEFSGFVLRVEGTDATGECHDTFVSGLSAEGFDGVTCTETEDQIACNAAKGNFITTATDNADGTTALRLESTGESPAVTQWVLRRR